MYRKLASRRYTGSRTLLASSRGDFLSHQSTGDPGTFFLYLTVNALFNLDGETKDEISFMQMKGHFDVIDTMRSINTGKRRTIGCYSVSAKGREGERERANRRQRGNWPLTLVVDACSPVCSDLHRQDGPVRSEGESCLPFAW